MYFLRIKCVAVLSTESRVESLSDTKLDTSFRVFPSRLTSDEFATRFLMEEKVAVVPGTAFGDCGEGFIRISYAYSLDNLKLAIGRLQHFVEKLRAEQNK